MHIAVDEISTCGISYRHHCERSDEEEGNHAERTVVEELHPKVADLNICTLLGIHHHLLLTLREAEQKQAETHDGIDGHGGEPCARVLGQTVSLLVGEVGDEQRQTRTNGKTATVGHEHANGGENRDLVGVASQG